MPYIPTTPETATVRTFTPGVAAEEEKTLDTFDIRSLTFQLFPGDPTKTVAEVMLLKGYDDNGALKVVDSKRIRLQGQGLVDALSANCLASNTRWDEVKNAVWALLEAEGHIPAGTVV